MFGFHKEALYCPYRTDAARTIQRSPSALHWILVIAEQLKDEGNVIGTALVADALSESALEVVDLRRIEGRVVEQNFDAIGTGFLDAAHGPMIIEDW